MLKKQTLFMGTLILLCANIIIKALGFFYRVILVRLLGTEGVGLTEMIVPVYSFFLVIAGWGIGLAMSRMIAHADEQKDYLRVAQIFTTGKTLLISNSLIVTLFAFLFAPHFITYIAPDTRIYHCFLLLIPSIFIIALSSSYRSFFQGIQQMSIIGGGQLTEQLIRTIVGISFALFLLPYGLEVAILAVAIGTFFGELGGNLYLWFRFRCLTARDYPLEKATSKICLPLAYNMAKFGTPVTLNRTVSSGILMLQSILIPLCLQKGGFDMPTATALYGNFAGVAMSLIHLPGVFTTSLTVSIIPGIAAVLHQPKALQNRINQALNATIYCTLPGMLVLFCYSSELCDFLFHAPEAAPILTLLSLGGIFLYLQITLSGILQGLGEVQYLLFTMVVNGILLLGGIYWLVPKPWLGIRGAAIAIMVSALASCLLNGWRLISKNYFRPQLWKGILLPLLAIFIGYLAMEISKIFLINSHYSFLATMTLSTAIAMAVYGGILLLCGAVIIPRKK